MIIDTISTDTFFILITLTLLIFYLYFRNKKINVIIEESIISHYKEKHFTVEKITILSLKEKVFYGVPLIAYYNLKYFISYFVSQSIIINRKVEIKNKDGLEFIVFIEQELKNDNLIKLKEFDLYEM